MAVKLTRPECLKIIKEYFLARGSRPTSDQFIKEIQKFYPKISITVKGQTQEVWNKEVNKAYGELRLCDLWMNQQGITEEEIKERGLHPDYSAV